MGRIMGWIGRHGVPLALLSVAALFIAMFWPGAIDGGRATLLGSALGALIAVGFAAAVTQYNEKQQALRVVKYCAGVATFVADCLQPIVTIFDAIGDDSRISESSRIQLERFIIDDYSARIGWASARLMRAHASFFSLPQSAIDSIGDIEIIYSSLNNAVQRPLQEWVLTYLENTTYDPKPKTARVARESMNELRRISTWLHSLAEGRVG